MKKTITAALTKLGRFTIFILFITLVNPSLVSAWGDNSGLPDMRPSYSLEQVNSGVLGNSIVFNSITIADTDYAYYKNTFGKDLPVGTITHEKNFVGARENTGVNAGAENVWNGNEITVEDGKEYLVRLYVHNNNPNGWDGVAENTKVAFNVPAQTSELVKQDDGTMKQQVQVNGYISSSNATPSEYWDYVNFQSDQAFHLDYVYGSALLENNGKAAGKLGDEIVNAKDGGVLIGYDALDGRVPGCYEYDNYITVKVRAVFDYEYAVEQKVRFAGSNNNWEDAIEANVGDKVEFRIEYKNTSNLEQTGVTIKNILPENLRYIEGTAELEKSSHPNKATAEHNYLVTGGNKIGDYKPGENAHIYFQAKVVDNDLDTGANMLTSWSQAGVGQKTIQDYASVIVYKNAAWFSIATTTLPVLIVLCLVAIAGLLFCRWRIRRNL